MPTPHAPHQWHVAVALDGSITVHRVPSHDHAGYRMADAESARHLADTLNWLTREIRHLQIELNRAGPR